MIAALKACKGMVYLAADMLGCAAQTIYDRAKASTEVKACLDQEDGKLTDLAEILLQRHILTGNLAAIKYRLSNKGRDRGYGEKLEITGKLDGDMNMSDDAQAKIASVIEEAIANRLGGEDDAEPDDSGEGEAGAVGGGDGGGLRAGEDEEVDAG